MQEPVKPIEPVRELVSTAINNFKSDKFNELDTLKEQLNYIEQCKNEYLNSNYYTEPIFKLELYTYWDELCMELVAYEYEDEITYNNKIIKYKADLINYKQQLEEYKKYRKQLYLQLKEEFNDVEE